MIRGEIRVKTRHFPTKNIPWEFRNFQTGISTRNWSKASQVPKSNLATSQDTTFLVIWDVVVSWSRQSEWKMRGFGWDGRWIWLVTIDGCWLSFWLEIACCRKKIWSCIFVFVRPIVRTMYVFLVKRVTKRPMFQKFGVFVGGNIEKSKQSIHKLELMVPPTWLICNLKTSHEPSSPV